METLFIILQHHQQSLGERAAIGFFTSLAIVIFIAIKNAISKNKKDFDEVKKDEDKNKDWND